MPAEESVQAKVVEDGHVQGGAHGSSRNTPSPSSGTVGHPQQAWGSQQAGGCSSQSAGACSAEELGGARRMGRDGAAGDG
eukprot:4081401-Amphidinium_carterae.1